MYQGWFVHIVVWYLFNTVFNDEGLFLRMTNQMLDVESTDRDLQIYTAKKINRTAQMIEDE